MPSAGRSRVRRGEDWRPERYEHDILGCRLSLQVPICKLVDYQGRESDLLADANVFGLITATHLITRATRRDKEERFRAKRMLIRNLYERGWQRQRILDLFLIIDWFLRLPKSLDRQLLDQIAAFETEEGKMNYVSSFEKLGIERGLQRGLQQGQAATLLRVLEKRFGPVGPAVQERLAQAETSTLDAWTNRALEASSLESVFDD